MTCNPSQVIVTTEDNPTHSARIFFVRHRDFPEVRVEAGSPEEAAARLADLLTRSLDSAPSHWRRDIVEQAVEDVRAFAKRDRL